MLDGKLARFRYKGPVVKFNTFNNTNEALLSLTTVSTTLVKSQSQSKGSMTTFKHASQ